MPIHAHNYNPELPVNPADPTPNSEVRRSDYEWSSPQARKTVAEETIVALTECELSLRFLDLSDPDDVDNFRECNGPCGARREFDSFEALERIKKMIRGYLRDKVTPWL